MTTKRTNSKRPLYFGFGAIIFAIGFFVYFQFKESSVKIFQDVIYNQTNDKQANIWSISYDKPKNIYITVTDPLTDKIIKKIKDKKESDLDYNIEFRICQQNSDIVVVGYGETPVFDVYNAVTFEKISDIKEFELIDDKLKNNIARFGKKSINSRYVNDIILEIITIPGNKYFYDIQKNKFFKNETELRTFITETDEKMAPKEIVVFSFFQSPDDSNQKLLYLITSTDQKNAYYLSTISGSVNNDIESFNKYKNRDCDKCTVTLLNEDKYTGCKIVYSDNSVVVFTSLKSDNSQGERIIAINKTGKKLFEISDSEYPNIEIKKKDKDRSIQVSGINHIMNKNQMIIFFGEYGALCIDLTTGEHLWKYEPKIEYKPQGTLKGSRR